MIRLDELIAAMPDNLVGANRLSPWLIPASLPGILPALINQLGNDYVINKDVAIHKTATTEPGAIIKGPAIIGAHTFIAAHAYLRGGVYIANGVVIGPGCEVKASIIFDNTHLAHFNFVGDSVIGRNVNFEAGAILCNHWNERTDKKITLVYNGMLIETGLEKLGALIADGGRVGANAVLAPGTILPVNAVVKRLQLIEQLPL